MWGRLACVVAIAAVSIDSPRAQDAVAEFYKGRQVTVIVGSSAGGGYDIYTRLLARHMPAGATAGLDQVRFYPRAGAGTRQGSSRYQQDGCAARRRFRQDAGGSPRDGLIYSSETFGRPYMMSPGVPAERVAALRKAFMTTMRDPELLAEAQKIGLVIDPISGEDLQALAEKIFATPATVVEQAKQALEYRAP